MATRSFIAMELSDEDKKKYNCNYMGVYCHWDGYLGYNGRVLFSCYKKYKQVFDLIKRGRISGLEPTKKDTKYFYPPQKRDKEVEFFNSKEQIDQMYFMVARTYVFENGEWVSKLTHTKAPYRKLTMRNTQPSKF